MSKLISFRTVTGDFATSSKALAWIQDQCKGLGLHMRTGSFDQFPVLVLTTQKTKAPKLWLVAHLDVVPGSDEMFRAQVKGNKLFGRGAFDMKFAIACYLKLLKEIGKELSLYDIGIMVTTDEETGGFNGVKKLTEEAGFGGAVAFIPDGGVSWKFEESAKGIWQVEVTSSGVSGHGSRPWLGANAITELAEFIHDLHAEIAPYKDDCAHAHATVNVGRIEGGRAVNQIADHAKAMLDIRFYSEEDRREMGQKIARAQKKHRGIKVTTKVLEKNFGTSLNNRYIKLFETIAKKHRRECGATFAHGSSDARFFAHKKVPTILISPEGGGHHSDAEWIDLKDLERYYEIIKEFTLTVGRIG